MRGNNKRKLINKELLLVIVTSYDLGVPLSKLIKNNQLDISAPHLRKLLYIYIEILDLRLDVKHRDKLLLSLFPIWLENTKGAVIQPDNWTYEGKFPLGIWVKRFPCLFHPNEWIINGVCNICRKDKAYKEEYYSNV